MLFRHSVSLFVGPFRAGSIFLLFIFALCKQFFHFLKSNILHAPHRAQISFRQSHARSAGFQTCPRASVFPAICSLLQTCCVADFQIGIPQAGLETRGTADLEVCATKATLLCAIIQKRMAIKGLECDNCVTMYWPSRARLALATAKSRFKSENWGQKNQEKIPSRTRRCVSMESRGCFGRSHGFANPFGIGSLSPGLRAASYPGGRHINNTTTLKGLNPFRKVSLFNPFRVVEFKRRYPG
jgi:hypothetical protein